jgi:hypothetical protein
MTSASTHRDCENDMAFVHVQPGPWVGYMRELQLRRHKCDRPAKQSDFEVFREAVDEWRNDTWLKCSIARRTAHPAYLRIIGLGQQAIPWILHELRQEPDYWFPALKALTRNKFSPKADSMKELRDAWLAWGDERDEN